MSDMPTPIVANFDNTIDQKSVRFGFRKVKDPQTGVETKRQTVELDKIPVPSVEGVSKILMEGGKGLELLLEAVANVVYDRARDVINEDENITSENFDYSCLSWDAIANLAKEDRRVGISKELWDDFVSNYVEIMPAISGVTLEQTTNAAKIFAAKFNPIKNKKDVIQKLLVRLALFTEHSPRAEEFSDIIEFLNKKAARLIAAKEESLEENLGL